LAVARTLHPRAASGARVAIAHVRAPLPRAGLTARRANTPRCAPQADAQVSAGRTHAPHRTLHVAPGLHCWSRRTAELSAVGTDAVRSALVSSAVKSAGFAVAEISAAEPITTVGALCADAVLRALASCVVGECRGGGGKGEVHGMSAAMPSIDQSFATQVQIRQALSTG
jgi:hypothetical protein